MLFLINLMKGRCTKAFNIYDVAFLRSAQLSDFHYAAFLYETALPSLIPSFA